MEDYARLSERLEEMGKNVKEIKERLKAQRLETPSWGYGNAGTRFAVFEEPGAARDIRERLQDAAEVHRLTGICPSVAVHIPWDKVADYEALKAEAESLGVRIGAVNPNLFQDPAYKMGSLTNVDAGVRRKAVDHLFECVEIMEAVDSDILSLWFGDGTNYPGQGDFRRRKAWM
jgi:L-rhamnose isomerase/sugar isomerase